MKVTDQNRNAIRWFIRILRDIGMRQEISEAICNALENDAQMDEMVEYLDKNTERLLAMDEETREQTILKQVAKIVEG